MSRLLLVWWKLCLNRLSVISECQSSVRYFIKKNSEIQSFCFRFFFFILEKALLHRCLTLYLNNFVVILIFYMELRIKKE